MIGGISSLVMSAALSAPPAAPVASARAAAAGMGRPPSRQAAPKMTAARPIMEPTERSMPPVIITGVVASASRPSSTESRTISKKLAAVKKLGARTANTAASRARAAASTHSPFGKAVSRHDLCTLSGADACIFLRTGAQPVEGYGSEDDGALERVLPPGADAEEGAGDGAAPAVDGCAANNDSGDDLQLEADARVGRDLAEADGIEKCGATGERAGNGEDGKDHAAGRDAGKAVGFRIGAGGIDSASGGESGEGPPGDTEERRRGGDGDGLAGGLREAEPLEAGRQVFDPRALRQPAQAVAEGDHGGERDDDRGDAQPGGEHAVGRAHQRAGKARGGAGEDDWKSGFGGGAGQNAADGELRADRDIDLAGEDHEQHADGDDQDGHVGHEEIAEVFGAEEAGGDEREDRGEEGDREGEGDFARVIHRRDAETPSQGKRLALRRAWRIRGAHACVSGGRKEPARPAGSLWTAALLVVSTPSARLRMRSWEASARSTMPARRPAWSTAMRSDMPRISGSSEEIMRIATPSWARSTIRRWISDLEPTSTPWVGSSRIMTEGRMASQRASATFCWLPPESEPASA